MPADLIIYALVAAGLVFWLRNILGTTHEDDPKRPHPLMQQPEEVQDILQHLQEQATGVPAKPVKASDKIIQLAQNKKGVLAIDNKTAENALLDLLDLMPDFDIEFFLQGAQGAFSMIVEAFAQGDRETLKDLLAPPVYTAFEQAITIREQKGDLQDSKIHDITRSAVTEVKIKEQMVFITVHFTALETSVTRNKDGKIIAGSPEKKSEMHDIWTFGREINSDDPRWFVFETRADHEEDNDLLPNAK